MGGSVQNGSRTVTETTKDWELNTGGGIAAMIRNAESMDGPTPADYPKWHDDRCAAFWCAMAQFWYWKANGRNLDADNSVE